MSFDTVYREAFESATGVPFADSVIQDQYRNYRDIHENQLIDYWTAPRSEITFDAIDKDVHVERIVHPAETEFDIEDAEFVTKVRFLGRVLIDTAKESLLANSNLSEIAQNPSEAVFVAVDKFQASEWSPAEQNTNRNSQDPDVASPIRLKDWPKGDYINCLGISIGLAAACELSEMPYVYANEVVQADNFLADRHCDMVLKIERIYPGVLNDSLTRTMMATFELVEPLNKGYQNIFFRTTDAAEQNAQHARDFHHYVVAKPSKDKEIWMQLDPYALITAHSLRLKQQMDGIRRHLHAAAGSTEVLLADNSVYLEKRFKTFDEVINKWKQWLAIARDQWPTYKSTNYFRDIEKLHEQAQKLMIQAYVSDRDTESVDEENYEEGLKIGFQNMYLTTMASLAYEFRDSNAPDGTEFRQRIATFRDLSDEQQEKARYENRSYTDQVEKWLHEQMQTDEQVRERVQRALEVMPLTYFLDLYQHLMLCIEFQVKDFGRENVVSELAQPEVMLGAMYLNHYATWRKDGRVNIAQQLARVIPSQLLWQAAQQDGVVKDSRVQAVGEVVKGLKPKQLHQLVHIARSIN